ncbi:FAD-dependent catabolic D-arginine dehydrogenase DauA [Rhodococcoides trifolii]|uniref:FAD-dependent catabolic D-arginine dehydrogenase DauA n=2 Tax=Rhodococcoides trifolii TaxID=908250 RepID=A0A917LFA3_9NOCA|nr:FAD-dependent catabolic D-arginine dehydrogenase DauA [Rhodococcus trifolii]
MTSPDIIVIGGGIAGVSLGYELADDHSVLLLERESTLAFHTTGRSAALFLETYGNLPIRALTTASRSFLENPPFDAELLSPRSLLEFARPGRSDDLRAFYDEISALTPSAEFLTEPEARELFPLLREGYAESAIYEPGSMEVDVHALHQGYVRGLRSRSAEIRTTSGIVGLTRTENEWTVTLADGSTVAAPIVVNAAGAWADSIAESAGVPTIGLQPMRRTIFMVGAPDDVDTSRWPTVSDIDEAFYIKPEGAQFLCSPADETPTPPSDARPDELEIARALDEINDATTLNARHVRTSWAGLRSFVADRTPVVGFDPEADGFFWCAGQGGYGIQTCAALARVGAALVRQQPIPADVSARGLEVEHLEVGRLR